MKLYQNCSENPTFSVDLKSFISVSVRPGFGGFVSVSVRFGRNPKKSFRSITTVGITWLFRIVLILLGSSVDITLHPRFNVDTTDLS